MAGIAGGAALARQSSTTKDGNDKGRRGEMRRPSFKKSNMWLRAGVPVAVIAEIGSRLRIVGTVGLHAVGDRIVAAGRGTHRNPACNKGPGRRNAPALNTPPRHNTPVTRSRRRPAHRPPPPG